MLGRIFKKIFFRFIFKPGKYYVTKDFDGCFYTIQYLPWKGSLGIFHDNGDCYIMISEDTDIHYPVYGFQAYTADEIIEYYRPMTKTERLLYK